MIAPVPRHEGPPVLRWIAVGLVLLAAAGLVILARTPGPAARGSLAQVLVVHRGLARRAEPPRDPGLFGPARALHSQAGGEPLQSWLYAVDRRAVTLHRLPEEPPWPGSAQRLPSEGGSIRVLDVDETSLACWPQEGATFCAVGEAPVASLKKLIERIRREGAPAP